MVRPGIQSTPICISGDEKETDWGCVLWTGFAGGRAGSRKRWLSFRRERGAYRWSKTKQSLCVLPKYRCFLLLVQVESSDRF